MKKFQFVFSLLVVFGLIIAACGQGNPAQEGVDGAPIAQPTQVAQMPTSAPAVQQNPPTATPAPTQAVVSPAPTATLTESFGDAHFVAGDFPGILPEVSKKYAVMQSTMAGVRYVFPNGTEVGSDKGWNQFTSVEPQQVWFDHLTGVTIVSVKPGETFTLKIRYDVINLDLGGGLIPAYASYLNALMIKAQDEDFYSWMAQGMSLSAQGHDVPLTISYDGGATTCSSPNVELVPGKDNIVTFSMPAGGSVAANYGVGGFGRLVNVQTGEEGDADIQKLGGNNVEPGCKDPEFHGSYEWLQSITH